MESLLSLLTEIGAIQKLTAGCIDAELSIAALEKAMFKINTRAIQAEAELKIYLSSNLSTKASTTLASSRDSDSTLRAKDAL